MQKWHQKVKSKPPAKLSQPSAQQSQAPNYAAIDLGTNSCRLVIATPTPTSFRIVETFSKITRLGEGIINNNELSRAAVKRTVGALKVCSGVLAEYAPIVKSRYVATAACRRAVNCQQFLDLVKKETGLNIEIISSKEESRLAVVGCIPLLSRNIKRALVFDIGGGSTEIAVISLGGIVANNSIRIAGDDFTADIQEYMSRQHNVKVSERMAERIKVHVGSALTDLGEDAPEDYVIHGPNRITALPMEVPVCYQEIAHCLDKTVAKIENAVLSALENTPPELYADIVKNGIWLTGGGALLRGLDKRLTDKINIPFHIAEDPLHSVATGAGIALKNVDRFSFLMR